jgi:hypothetical protein
MGCHAIAAVVVVVAAAAAVVGGRGGGRMPDYVECNISKFKRKISDISCLLSLKNKSAETSNGESIFHSLYIIDIYTYIPIIIYSFYVPVITVQNISIILELKFQKVAV